MDPVWLSITSFLGIFTLAIISPGPNFVLVVNRSLGGCRREGVWTALGVALGSGLYGLLGLLGLIPLLDSSASAHLLIRLGGGLYLVYLGVRLAVQAWRRSTPPAGDPPMATGSGDRGTALVLGGLLTNLSNPKAWVFYLSLFTVVLNPGIPVWTKVFLNLAMFAISFGWYTLVALLVSGSHGRGRFRPLQTLGQGVLGGILIWFGLQVLLG